MNKADLRQQIKLRFLKFTPQQLTAKSNAIQHKLLRSPHFAQAGALFIFNSLKDEPQTHGIIAAAQAAGKAVFCPAFSNGQWCAPLQQLTAACNLQTNGGVHVTGAGQKNLLCVVPLVGFSTLGERLGRGGGWYDRVLSAIDNACSQAAPPDKERRQSTANEHKKVVKIGLAFDFQQLPAGFGEPHDAKLDGVICG